jgi:DNA-binding CsgD family transcriptional regulator
VLARRGAVITGPAGAGKTTLAAMALQLAEQQGMSLARATATAASRELPFGALASFLPSDPGGDGTRRDGQLLRRYAQALLDRAAGRPLVLFVDDAHLLDDGSATLVHHLALTRAATVVATVRAGAVAPDAVVALWKDDLGERIEVGVLDDVSTEELLGSVLGGPADAASVRQFVDRCQGNPLYLRELVTGARESGVLIEEGGIWRIRGALRPTSRLVELVALRVGELTRPQRAVLELLTVGEPLGQAELARLAEPEAVDTLENKGLITSRLDGHRVGVWLAHPMYGDVARVQMSILRERAIARSLAEVIEAAGSRRREDTLRLASLRLVGGGGSAELMLAGAIAARARHDYPVTERMARAAIAAGGGFDARFAAAEAAHVQGRPGQAEEELAALATDASSDAERARIALVRFDNAYFLQSRADFRLINEVADVIGDPFWRDQLDSRRLYVMSLSTGPRATAEAASAFLRHLPSRSCAVGHIGASYSLARLGHLDDALGLLTSPPGGKALPEPDGPWEEWSLLRARALALGFAGRLGEAEDLLGRAYALVINQPTAEARAYVTHALAAVHLEQGRPVSAFRRASESYTLFRQLGRRIQARWSYIAAAHALAVAGHAHRAAQALAAHDSLGLPPAGPDQPDLLQARAAAAAAAGDVPAARDHLEAAASLGEKIGDLIGATSALHALARLGRARQVAARLAGLAGQVDGALVAARAAYASALADRNSADLARVGGDFEDLGAFLYAAEASAEAAVLFRRAGQARDAAAAERKAGRLLARCEGAVTPSAQLITARVRLTPGELETALQAAAGRSSKQIASEGQLSVRTVESHLLRAYQKLGISRRHELADALRDQP